MIDSFPLSSGNQDLTEKDFKRFSNAFADIVLRKIPTSKDVKFIFDRNQLKVSLNEESVNDLVMLFDSVCGNASECGIFDHFLMVPFALKDGTIGVSLLSNLDFLFIKRVTEEWLSDVRAEIEREFLLLKQARVDDQTGLLNLSNLYSLFDNQAQDRSVELILVEIPPKKSSFQLIANHLHACVLSLGNFTPDGAVIHHLGNSLFAIVIELDRGNTYIQFSSSLVAYLKREGFVRVYAGTSRFICSDSENMQTVGARRLLDEAWTALRVAAKRGPFGYCDFSLLAYPEGHPLVRPGQALTRRFRRLWDKSEKFCLVHFRSDNAKYDAYEIVSPFLTTGTPIPSGGDVVLYLEGGEGDAVRKWIENIVRQCRKRDSDKTVSAGIASFPYSDFVKSSTLYNSRKALSHAAFYGSSGVALFDAVSLNISGDIYFSDGDMIKAVKEYKNGLKCDERNVNLQNSLGVAYTMMNKISEAMSCFEKALKLDERNLMALYNIGLCELSRNNNEEAITFFKQALNCDFEDSNGGQTLKSDIERQIGVLASETGDYRLALDYLLPWYETCASRSQAERLIFNIGKSYYGLGKNKKAMEWLQRCLQKNEYDDHAMHLLGIVYFAEGEGNEIALSLCRKSVELMPNNMKYRLGLARIEFQCGMIDDARRNLKQCLKNKELRAESQLLLAHCCLEIGHYKRALNWFNKIRVEDGRRFVLYKNLKQRLSPHFS